MYSKISVLIAGLLAWPVIAAAEPPIPGNHHVRVYQESAPGAGDFKAYYLGEIQSFSDGAKSAEAIYNKTNGSYNAAAPFPAAVIAGSQFFLVETADADLALFIVQDSPAADPANPPEVAQVAIREVAPGSNTMAFIFKDGEGPEDGHSVLPGESILLNQWFGGFTDGAVLDVSAALDTTSRGITLAFEFAGSNAALESWQASSPAPDPALELTLEYGRRVLLQSFSPAATYTKKIPAEEDNLRKILSAIEPLGATEQTRKKLQKNSAKRVKELKQKQKVAIEYQRRAGKDKTAAVKHDYSRKEDARNAKDRVKDLAKGIRRDDTEKPLNSTVRILDRQGYAAAPPVMGALISSRESDAQFSAQETRLLEEELEEAKRFTDKAIKQSPKRKQRLERKTAQAEELLKAVRLAKTQHAATLDKAKTTSDITLVKELGKEASELDRRLRRAMDSVSELNGEAAKGL